MRKPTRHQRQPAFENPPRLTRTPVLPLGLRRDKAGANDEVDGGRETGFTEVETAGKRGTQDRAGWARAASARSEPSGTP